MKTITKLFIGCLATACNATPIDITVPPDVLAHPYWPQFYNFVDTHDKQYNTDEFRDRFAVFVRNIGRINDVFYKDNYNASINEWADLMEEEFSDKMGAGCVHISAPSYGCDSYLPTKLELNNLPDEIDWRYKNAVTPVKNQKKCGSCWSFSATGAMEGAWAIETGDLVSLSEQQLLDCSVSYGNNACNGGIMAEAFQYAIHNGMCSESEDPYEADSGYCTDCTPVVEIANCYNVQSGNQLHLKAAVARGPVSVAIEADMSVFQFYSGGVLRSKDCGDNLDHGVLVVGYGQENGIKYWLVKNSWGPEWGQDGYIKIERSDSENDMGVCGIATQPVFPSAKKNTSTANTSTTNTSVCHRWADTLAI